MRRTTNSFRPFVQLSMARSIVPHRSRTIRGRALAFESGVSLAGPPRGCLLGQHAEAERAGGLTADTNTQFMIPFDTCRKCASRFKAAIALRSTPDWYLPGHTVRCAVQRHDGVSKIAADSDQPWGADPKRGFDA